MLESLREYWDDPPDSRFDRCDKGVINRSACLETGFRWAVTFNKPTNTLEFWYAEPEGPLLSLGVLDSANAGALAAELQRGSLSPVVLFKHRKTTHSKTEVFQMTEVFQQRVV